MPVGRQVAERQARELKPARDPHAKAPERPSARTAAATAAGPSGSASATRRGSSGACPQRAATPTTPPARGSSDGSRTSSSTNGIGGISTGEFMGRLEAYLKYHRGRRIKESSARLSPTEYGEDLDTPRRVQEINYILPLQLCNRIHALVIQPAHLFVRLNSCESCSSEICTIESREGRI